MTSGDFCAYKHKRCFRRLRAAQIPGEGKAAASSAASTFCRDRQCAEFTFGSRQRGRSEKQTSSRYLVIRRPIFYRDCSLANGPPFRCLHSCAESHRLAPVRIEHQTSRREGLSSSPPPHPSE